MTDPSKDPEKKIIVDEDWKSQVEAEKRAAQQESKPSEQTESAEQESAEQEPEGPLPPPTLNVLASSLYLQGMISLGLMPTPGAEAPEVKLHHAKHAIDTLQMLEEKTKGNRTPEEDKEMDDMLHQIRMAFVSVQQHAAAGDR